MTAQCPDNCTSRHILNGHGGRVKFATGSTDIRCEIFHGQLRTLLRALPNETHGAGPTCFSCTNPTMNLFFSVSFFPVFPSFPRCRIYSPHSLVARSARILFSSFLLSILMLQRLSVLLISHQILR